MILVITSRISCVRPRAMPPQQKYSDDDPEEADKNKKFRALDEGDIALLKTYGLGPYNKAIGAVQDDIKKLNARIQEVVGVKESDTGLAPPSQWDLVSDKQMMQEEHSLQVARCTKIINPNTDDAKYVINVKQLAKFVVGLGERVAPADIEEGMRVGVDRHKYQIQIPLPPKIDPTVTMMTVEEKPDITYNDIGGNKEEIQKLREVLELPMLHPERFVQLGVDPPKVRAARASRSLGRPASAILPLSPVPTRARASRVCCFTGRPARAKRSPRALSPTAPMRASSASSVPSWYRSTWARAHAWCASSSRWLVLRRHASSSSTRWMRSAARASTTARAATTRCSGRCLRSGGL